MSKPITGYAILSRTIMVGHNTNPWGFWGFVYTNEMELFRAARQIGADNGYQEFKICKIEEVEL